MKKLIRIDVGLLCGLAGATLVATGISASGCRTITRGFPVLEDQCATTALRVRWPPGRILDMKFATINDAGFEHAKHYCVGFEEAGLSGEYHLLCGIESAGDAGAKFYLTPKNHADGQPPEPDPQGPGMRHTIGWSFITFSWPLIWVRNIDAGSIGTTAIERWEDVNGVPHLSLYLVRNGKPTPSSGPLDPPQPDTTSRLFLNAGYPYASFELPVPAGKEIVRVRFYEESGTSTRMIPIESAPGVWEQISFDAADDGTGAIVVTATEPGGNADCAFLAGVLQKARAETIYRLPSDPPP